MIGFDAGRQSSYLFLKLKNLIFSVDYNSFLTRDYKSLVESPRQAKRPRWTRLHMLLLVAVIMVAGTVLSLLSGEAAASRSATRTVLAPKILQEKQAITIPLEFPALQSANPATITTNAIADEPEQPWLTVKVKRGDALAMIFKRHNLSPLDLHNIMAMGKITATLKSLRPDQVFRFQLDENGQLQSLEYEINQLESLLVSRLPDGKFEARAVQHTLDKRISYTAGTISSSLFEAGKEGGMTDALIMEMVGIFGWDIDFALDIRDGDRFALLYEEQFLEGQKVKDGPIVAAEFTSQGRTYRAVRYTDAEGRTDYYSPDGHSMRKAFLRTPVDFRRISSRFGNRHHPTLNQMKMHKGVDYAASRGTPIKAAGDGKISFQGRKGGYGRVVIIQHGGRYSTLYAHMNSFKKGMYVGKRVKQGDIIGYVGSSGRATGPHLHYEFRVNGTHRNPLTVKLPDAAPIQSEYRQDFDLKTRGLLSQLDMHTRTRVALSNN
jgi:murein DD-endopeptidase MepM/ murein hydrolase activator NlpD